MPYNHTIYIDSVKEYLEEISIITKKYDCGFKNEALWFRGIADLEKFSLLPSVLRGSILDENDSSFFNESEIFNAFKRESRSYIKDIDEDDTLSLMCYAQHFNAPTRLLDFTANPLVALYFACKDLKTKDGAVWILNSKLYNKII